MVYNQQKSRKDKFNPICFKLLAEKFPEIFLNTGDIFYSKTFALN